MDGWAQLATKTAHGYTEGDIISLRPADTYTMMERREYLIQKVTGLSRDDFRDLVGVEFASVATRPSDPIVVLRKRFNFINWRANLGGATVPDDGGRTATVDDVQDERTYVQTTSRTRIVVETR